MTVATLMEYGDPAFAFDHYMAHSQYYGVMSPLDRFTVLPYLLDPAYSQNISAGPWHLNHQQAHNDSLLTLPSYFGATTVGIPISQNVVDTNLADPEQLTWWTFANLIEHQMAGLSLQLPGPYWVFPFA